MESYFDKKCETIFNRIEQLKIEIVELKLLHFISQNSSVSNYNDYLPVNAFMPSDELAKRCKEYSDHKYSSVIRRSQTR